jgi:hypothetical protein
MVKPQAPAALPPEKESPEFHLEEKCLNTVLRSYTWMWVAVNAFFSLSSSVTVIVVTEESAI